MYSKKDKKAVLIPDAFFCLFFFLRRFQKWKQKTKKIKAFSEDFFYKLERRKKIIWDGNSLNTLPLQFLSYKWWLRIKRKDSFYSILELWLFTNHMDICGCSYFLYIFFLFQFVPTLRRVGFASALLPYGQWVVLSWGRVGDVTRTQTRSSKWTVLCECVPVCFCLCVCECVCGSGSWDLISQWSGGTKAGLFFLSLLLFSFYVFKWSAGLRKPWREARGRSLLSSTLTSTHTLPSPTHLCTFVHSSCEVPFWGWEHNWQQEDCYDLDTVGDEKKNSQKLNWETREARLLLPPVHNHIFVLPFKVERKKRCKRMKEKIVRH